MSLPNDEARQALCIELAETLSRRLRASKSFGAETRRCVAELRDIGHDLFSFDEDENFQAWCPNWAQPTGPGITIMFREPNCVEVGWAPS